MAEEQSPQKPSANDYMRGGKGRKDEVGGSGIYPASVPDAPADAELRGQGELVGHKGPGQKPAAEPGVRKPESTSESE
jgi:hypothetical protein